MLFVRLGITLTLAGPILTQWTAQGDPGIDAPMARDSQDRFYLPFSLVKGRLRQSCMELEEAGVIPPGRTLEVCGKDPDTDTGTWDPERGLLRFTDFVHGGPRAKSELTYRVRIDDERGAADEGALQVIESPFASGKEVDFTGTIEFFAADAMAAEILGQQIEWGLRWTTSFGAERTAGFGRLRTVRVAKSEKEIVGPRAGPIGPDAGPGMALGLRLTLDEPFCVARRQLKQYLFESDTILSGAVLKGALAATLNAMAGRVSTKRIDASFPAPWEALGRNFDNLRFTHAFPADAADPRRPVVPPLSLVKAAKPRAAVEGKPHDPAWWDVALCPGPGLIDERAPAFAIDWKDDSDVRIDFGWCLQAPEGWREPRRELRVRTAMDRSSRRARDEKLFAYEMIVPEGFSWFARLDLHKVPEGEQGDVIAQLAAVFEQVGLWSVGKTKARAKVELVEAGKPAARHDSSAASRDGVWVITLQTPALLCDPRPLNETSGENELRAAYERVWQEDLGRDNEKGSLVRLIRFFASQTLYGGYLTNRFQRGKPYNPFLLTDAGSVFVFEAAAGASPADVQTRIQEWLDHGLPLSRWAKDEYGDDWSTCPFRPQEGFGEIAVNLSCHREPPNYEHVPMSLREASGHAV